MNGEIGTLAWTTETNGNLSPRESRALFKDLLTVQLRIIPDEWLHKHGLRKARDLGVDLDSLAPPETAASNAARLACKAASPEYLVQHCERSYWWARILAELAGLRPDPELLYTAAMFHDLGITEVHGASNEALWLSVDEDVALDAERVHTAERLEYLAFGAVTVFPGVGVCPVGMSWQETFSQPNATQPVDWFDTVGRNSLEERDRFKVYVRDRRRAGEAVDGPARGWRGRTRGRLGRGARRPPAGRLWRGRAAAGHPATFRQGGDGRRHLPAWLPGTARCSVGLSRGESFPCAPP